MTEVEIQKILEGQKKYFASGATLPVKTRIAALKKLYSVIKENEKMITAADGAVVSRVDCITELEAELIYNTQQVEDYKFQFEAHNNLLR